MIIKDKYYVLRTKSNPIQFYLDKENWLQDDFRNALKFKSKKGLEVFIEDENYRNKQAGLYGDDENPFEQYKIMQVNVTYEF